MYLIDTNVISEVIKAAPHGRVLDWLIQMDEDRLFLSVVSLAEIRRGVALMDEGKKRDDIAHWLSVDLLLRFEKRLLHIDDTVALVWGDLMATAKKCGRGLSVMDGLIAATAIARNMILVTRNTKDFAGFGIEVFNPWDVV